MSEYDIHSCGYYCDRHACIVAQRNELRDKLFSDQATRKPILPGGGGGSGEPTIDGWPLWSGLPPVKVQDEREENYKSFAQSAQVLGAQYDPRREPVIDKSMAKRIATQLGWEPKRESVYCGCGDEIVAGDGARCGTCVAVKFKEKKWVGLTDEELLDIADMAYANDLELLQTLQAKLKEKNDG